MWATGIEYVWVVAWKVRGQTRHEMFYDYGEAQVFAKGLNDKGYTTTIEQQLA